MKNIVHPVQAKSPSRRTVLKGAGAAAGVVAASSLGFPALAQSKPEQLVIASGGGALDEAYKAAYFDSFTEKTGIPIITAPYAGVAKIKSMYEAGSVELDLLNTDSAEAAIASRKGWLVPLDWSLSDRADILPGAAFDDFVSSEVAATCLAWNTDSFPAGKAPTRWEDMMDMENFPGIRAFWKNATGTLEIVLMASGVAPDKLYPLDLDRALGALSKIRDETIFWEHGAQSAQLLIDGETEISSAWNGRLYEPKKDGAPIDYTFNGSLLVAGAWVIVKGANNVKWAQDFIAHANEPARQAVYAEHIPYGPVAASAYELISDERKAELPDPALGVWQNFGYWAEHGEALNGAFADWLVGG